MTIPLTVRPGDRDLIELHTIWCVAAGLSARTTIPDRGELLARVSVDLGPLLTLTGEQLAGWLGRDGWASQTKATYHGHLSGFYRWCVDTDRLAVSPMAKLRKPRVPKRVPRPAPRDVFARIVATAAPRFILAAVLAAYAGLRACEIAAIRREDITADTLTVVDGKGGKTATVPTHAMIWEAVKDLPPGPVVRTAWGGQYTATGISRAFGIHMREQLGIEKVTLHNLRHRFGTSVYQQTRDLLVTQQLLRHSSVATTQIYALVEEEAPRAAIAGLTL